MLEGEWWEIQVWRVTLFAATETKCKGFTAGAFVFFRVHLAKVNPLYSIGYKGDRMVLHKLFHTGIEFLDYSTQSQAVGNICF